MYTKQPKKMLIMNILEILMKYSDENHRLSQKQILEILKRDYDMDAERKSIRRNLLELMDCGYNIEYTEGKRLVKNHKTKEVEEKDVWTDFYMVREFSEGEIRLLIDSILFSKQITHNQCKELIKKLKNLSNNYFDSRVEHISRIPDEKVDNQQLFLNIELIDEAIKKRRKISFKYVEYGSDKKLVFKKRENGEVRNYIVTPYQMAAKEGKYYLICNYDKYDDISNYRMDRIRDIEILNVPAKDFSKLRGSNGSALDLNTYMREHIYMYSSDNTRAKMRIPKVMITDIIDLFGKDVAFSDDIDDRISVTVKANKTSIEQFAQNYAPDVIVLEPPSMVDQLMNTMKISLVEYEKVKEVK